MIKKLFISVLCVFLVACQTPPAVLTPTPAGSGFNSLASPTPPLNAPLANPTLPIPAGLGSAGNSLAEMQTALQNAQTAQWTVRFAGSAVVEGQHSVTEDTATTCAIQRPEQAYCVTQFLQRANGQTGGPMLELLQIGTQQWAREGSPSWDPLGGDGKLASIVIHDLFRLTGDGLQFFPAGYISEVEDLGEETLNGELLQKIRLTFNTDQFDLYTAWYGLEKPSYPNSSMTLTTVLWLGREDHLPRQSETVQELLYGTSILTLTAATRYDSFNQPVTIPEP